MEHQIVMRLAKFLLVLNVCFLYANSDENTIQSNGISQDTKPTNVTAESLKCEGVEGSVPECSECYPCDSPIVQKHRSSSSHEIKELKLNDINCSDNETICCILLRDSVFREKNDTDRKCGHVNPEGDPRALRPSIRAVLQGEYPWRAWIYDALKPDTPLCAAVYVDRASSMLLTTASCVHGRGPHELEVRFDEFNPLVVQRIDVHEGFKKSTDENNLAALRVTNVSEWAKPVCLPDKPAPQGSSCVAVAGNGFSLSQVIPLQTKCNKDDKPLYSSLMCTSPFRGDFPSELGGGVFCADEQAPQLIYSLYGLYLRSESEGLVAMNVNVTHFGSWITKKGKEYQNI